MPSPADPPSGCWFRTRCPVVMDTCAEIDPQARTVSSTHTAACLRVESEPAADRPAAPTV